MAGSICFKASIVSKPDKPPGMVRSTIATVMLRPFWHSDSMSSIASSPFAALSGTREIVLRMADEIARIEGSSSTIRMLPREEEGVGSNEWGIFMLVGERMVY